MEHSTAQRRLVKSPPELWAEVSSESLLGRRLAEFGEIRITRVEPETTVAWEGDRASGTVELAPAGWGTKVILTATPLSGAASEPQTRPTAKTGPSAQPRPTAATGRNPEPAPPTPEVPAIAPDSTEAQAPAHAPAPPPRRGFFSRLFRRRPKTALALAIPAPPPAPPADAPPVAARARPPLDAERTAAILTEVLDDLGAAHHRPYSRD